MLTQLPQPSRKGTKRQQALQREQAQWVAGGSPEDCSWLHFALFSALQQQACHALALS